MTCLIDTHIHLDVPELAGSETSLLAAARQAGIGRFILPGIRLSGWPGQLDLAAREEGVFAAPGLHPAYADQWSAAAAEELRQLARQPQVVAIGEIGLDGAAGPPLDRQEEVLRSQLTIAEEANLPVLLHGRKATGRLLEVLRDAPNSAKLNGIWHGFSGSMQVAEELVDLGFKIGVGPILLRPSARKLPQAVVELPAEALVLETDLPDMAEQPQALLSVAQKVAQLRGCTFEETARITTENACRLFGF